MIQPTKYFAAAQYRTTICLLLTSLYATAATAAEACNPYCSVNIVEEHAPVFLQNMASHLGIQVELEGDLVDPISAVFERVSAQTFDQKALL